MNQKKKKQITYWLSVVVVGIALGFAIQFVRAWTEPSVAPPGGNVGAPINTGGNPQAKGTGNTPRTDKPGSIVANDFCLPSGLCLSNVGVGSTTPPPPPATPPSTCSIWGPLAVGSYGLHYTGCGAPGVTGTVTWNGPPVPGNYPSGTNITTGDVTGETTYNFVCVSGVWNCLSMTPTYHWPPGV